jgi:hypothetical protein
MSLVSAAPLFTARNSRSGYQLEQSLRFNDADSPYVSRTPGSAGNRRTWTMSFWIKRAQPDTSYRQLFSAGASASADRINVFFGSAGGGNGDQISFGYNPNNAGWSYVVTSAVLRDFSAWYHIVIAVDTTQATASNRVKIYINGVLQSDLSTASYPSQNVELAWNNNVYQVIGAYNLSGASALYTDAYFAEFYGIDGSALDHEDFGELDNNGVWRPIETNFTEATRYSASGYESIFDGNTATGVVVSNSYVTVASGLNITAGSTVGFYDNGGSQLKSMRINGTTEFTVTGGTGWQDFSFTGTINTIELKYNGSTLYTGIRVDGTTLVDNYGDYGQNGFYLKFDPSATNGIGHDHSGNGNNWTANNFTTSGTGTDVMSDTPTTNYATFNPLHRFTASNGNYSPALSDGNLVVSGPTYQGIGRSTIAMSSGKFYFEATITYIDPDALVGIYKEPFGEGTVFWQQTTQVAYYSGTGTVRTPGDTTVQTYSTYTTGDVIGVALDLDNGKVFFSKNGTWQGSSDPAAGTNPAVSGQYKWHCHCQLWTTRLCVHPTDRFQGTEHQ